MVNWPGFLLLVEVFRGSASCDLLPIAKVKLETGLLKIAGYAAGQTKPVKKFTMEDFHCESAKEGAACTALLQQCQEWRIETFRMTGDLGEPFWEGMATATSSDCEKENLRSVRVTRKVLKRGRRDHLRKVCHASKKASWNVYAMEFCDKKQKGEKGWNVIEKILDTA